ncbi:MAG: LysR family transcriptional regulator [Lachnospiraceae bacterium]|nr:LysR family transcriptional regulator [Lachnospiraceae bacterium]
MTLKQMETFKLLSKELNFTRTAETLGIAQSAVTNQIKDLEAELGVKLFERIAKNISLTHEGEMLIPYANRMLSVKEDIKNLYSNEGSKKTGKIVIGISDILCNTLLPQILKEFHFVCPDMKVKIVRLYDILPNQTGYEENSNPLDMLKTHQIDAALVMSPFDSLGSNFFVHKKSRQNIVLLSAYSHDFSGSNRITKDRLSDTQFLLPDKSCCYNHLFMDRMVSLGIDVDIALESNSTETLKENASTGLGLCLIPENTARKELMTHAFERVNFDMSFDVYSLLITHKDKWISGELKKFIDIAKDII